MKRCLCDAFTNELLRRRLRVMFFCQVYELFPGLKLLIKSVNYGLKCVAQIGMASFSSRTNQLPQKFSCLLSRARSVCAMHRCAVSLVTSDPAQTSQSHHINKLIFISVRSQNHQAATD